MPRLDDARLSPLGTPFRRPFLTGDDFAPVRKPEALLSKPVETRLDGPTKDRALGQAQAEASQAAPAQAAWRAKIALTLGVDKSLETGAVGPLGRSRIKKLSFEGPLRVQKLFYPEKPAPGEVETCHLYLLHPPGGLVSGDLLEYDLRLTEGARAVVTTPAAAKIYRARDELSVQAIKTRVEVDDGSVLEWFPQGTIAFDGARASLGQAFDVALGARALGCDFVALGRGASGESFSKGAFRQLTQIFRGPKLLFHELVNLQGDDELLLSPLGLMGRPVMALFWAVGRPNRAGDAQALTDSLKTLQSFEDFGPGPYALAQSGSPVFSVSSRHGLFLARALTASLQEAEAFRFRVWSIIRPRLLGREPLPPYVWAT